MRSRLRADSHVRVRILTGGLSCAALQGVHAWELQEDVEESMGLEAGTLDASQYRKAVRKIAEDYIVSYYCSGGNA